MMEKEVRGSDQPDHSSRIHGDGCLEEGIYFVDGPSCQRASCGDAMAPAASLVLTAITYNSRRNLWWEIFV
jgi:hypothetical protein